MSTLASVVIFDLLANQPAAGIPGRLFFASDTNQAFRDNGTAWDNLPTGTGMTNPMTTAGDIIKGGTSGAAQRLAIGSNGQVLQVVSGAPAWTTQPYHIYICLPIKPTAGQVLFEAKIAGGMTLTLPANLANSQYEVIANPTATAVYNINKNGTSVATVSIATSGTVTLATSSGTAQTFTGGTDVLQVVGPSSQDATLIGNLTIAATRS